MLFVFMAFINFTKMKLYAATRWLWLALSGGLFVAAPIGCEEEGQPLYGAPSDVWMLDSCDQDALVQPVYGVPADAIEPDAASDSYVPDEFQTLYGPPPDYIEYDAVQDNGQDQNIQPLYGAVDVIYDGREPDTVPPDDMIQPLYGAVSDVIDDSETSVPDAEDGDISPDLPQTLYGPAVK